MPIAAEAVYENGVLKLEAPVDLPERAKVHVTIEPSEPAARTPLGRRLRQLRSEIRAAGAPPLDWDQISEEVARRRGGWQESR